MNNWVFELDSAIEDLEARKKLLQKSCMTCWDPSIDWALDGLKIIRQMLKAHEPYGAYGELEWLITEIHERKKYTNDRL